MSSELSDLIAYAETIVTAIKLNDEVKDVRKSRLELTLALINKGMEPDKAVETAKNLVVKLMAAVSS